MREYSTPAKMKKIGDLFDCYRKTLFAPQKTVEKVCLITIKEVTGFILSEECVDYKVSTKTLYIKAPSLLKSELKFHHSIILEEVKKKLSGKEYPTTIL
jgi:hypothetical protein